MKTKTTIITILSILIASGVFASSTPKIELTPLNGAKVLITVKQEPGTKHTLTIVSNSGEIIYVKKYRQNVKYKKQIFDFTNLENGNYEVKLKAGKTTLCNDLNITNGVVQVKEQHKEIAPYFYFENNLIKITYLNFEKNNVEALIYQGNQLIHQSKYGNEFKLNECLNLTKLETGRYDLCLSSGNKEYWFSFGR
jgi:hypothetical protein